MTAHVKAEQYSRLEDLAAQYDYAKAQADTAAETLKTITDGIKAELANAAAGESRVLLQAEGLANPLLLMAVESWRVDTKRLKEQDPATYVQYAVKSTAWHLKPAK